MKGSGRALHLEGSHFSKQASGNVIPGHPCMFKLHVKFAFGLWRFFDGIVNRVIVDFPKT